ncbi:MAG: hypothetical protein HQM13_14770 [SAR324 cluster bacterium]|nr:hypothetical protein [SAR324 cluster bacterium]
MLKNLLFRYKTSSKSNYHKLLWSIPKMLLLDKMVKTENITREMAMKGTLQWLINAQNATQDGGVSGGFSMIFGWTKSYPETTGYIMQTLIRHYNLFGEHEVLERAKRMAEWEVDILCEEGGTPSGGRPVAFNTGQVLMGWAELLRIENVPRIRDAAAKAGYWLMECMSSEGYFEKGVSDASSHGKLSHNAMVSWGMMDIAMVLNDEKLADAALRSALYYAGTVDQMGWPTMTGIDVPEVDFPLTHALGYTAQGLLETGLLSNNQELIEKSVKILKGSLNVMDAKTGFLPGRVSNGWSGGSSWTCLTGSAQFACCMLSLELSGRSEGFLPFAEKLIDFVISTQFSYDALKLPIAYGVRGSFPFHFGGYCRATYVNWAAKFHLDALHMLHRLEKLQNGNSLS